MKSSSILKPILIGGLIAGTLDITYACVFFGIRFHLSPIRIFQSVARGALGQSAFQGGLKIAALGLFFHFLIALTAATVYYVASRGLRFMVTHAIVCGLLYGVCVLLHVWNRHARFGDSFHDLTLGVSLGRVDSEPADSHARHRAANRTCDAPLFQVTILSHAPE